MDYHIAIDGQRSGPHSESEIRARIAAGTFQAKDLCWSIGWPEWKTAGAVFPEFQQATPSVPAAAIAATVPPLPRAVVRIDGKSLVVPVDYVFPKICLKTGATENLVAKSKRVHWHPSAVYLVLLLNVLIYAIVAMVMRKKSTHGFCLCEEANRSHRNWTLCTWGLFLGGLAFLFIGLGLDRPALCALFPIGLIGSIITGFAKVRLFYPVKIDQTHVHLRGIAPRIMEQIAARG